MDIELELTLNSTTAFSTKKTATNIYLKHQCVFFNTNEAAMKSSWSSHKTTLNSLRQDNQHFPPTHHSPASICKQHLKRKRKREREREREFSSMSLTLTFLLY